MDLPKLIILCCIIFLLALLTYIIIKKKDEIKAYILKIDEKISKHNSSNLDNKKTESNKEKQEENESKELKEKPSSKNKTSESEKGNNSNKEESSPKLKASKAVSEIRPVLLPPNRDAEERDVKLLEMSKRPEMITGQPQKALDFKYGSSRMASQNMGYQQPNYQMQTQRQQKSIQQINSRARTNSNDFISFNRDNDNFNPLKRDVKKQFDDIKNFIELPENQSTMQNKGVSYNGRNFNTVDKIDASIFNSPESHYVDYRQGGFPPRTRSTVINNVNNAIQNNYKNNAFLNQQNANYQNNATGNVMFTNTKYARNPSTQYGMPSYNITEREQQEANKYNNIDYSLTKEQEDIDLNKLPNNLKKMIIQNILDRKNYD